MPAERQWGYFAVLKLATIFVNCKFWAKKMTETVKYPVSALYIKKNGEVLLLACTQLLNILSLHHLLAVGD